MKIDLGYGVYLEPDEAPRDTPFHKRIVRLSPIAGTQSGRYADLECGHRVATFGDLSHCEGVVLCTECRDMAT